MWSWFEVFSRELLYFFCKTSEWFLNPLMFKDHIFTPDFCGDFLLFDLYIFVFSVNIGTWNFAALSLCSYNKYRIRIPQRNIHWIENQFRYIFSLTFQGLMKLTISLVYFIFICLCLYNSTIFNSILKLLVYHNYWLSSIL